MTPTRRTWNRLNTLFLLGTLGLALVAVPWHLAVNGFRWMEWTAFAAMTFLCGTAISAGYHRLFSHRAFKARLPVRLFVLAFGAANFENSVLRWASDHRRHHRHVDDLDKDPYAIGRGFWWAHWGWVMASEERPLDGVADLQQDPWVRLQHRWIFSIGAGVALLPLLLIFWGGDGLGLLIVAVLLRIVVNHHTTFLINSLAHWMGTRPYSTAISARDSWLLAPFTYGEGYHNFHHTWQWDYRNGVRWYHWDSTKWFLNLLRWAGLVSQLRRVPRETILRARLAVEAQRLAAPDLPQNLAERLAQARLTLDQALANLLAQREAGRALRALRRKERRNQWALRQAAWRESWRQAKREVHSAWDQWRMARAEVRA